jgi:hypothetical protein
MRPRHRPASTKKGERRYRYYRCGIHDNAGGERCSAPQLPAVAFEAFVAEELKTLAEQRNLAELLRTNVHRRAERLRAESAEIPRTIASKSGRAAQLATVLSELSGPARFGPERELAEIGEELRALEQGRYETDRELAAFETKVRTEAEWLCCRLEGGSAWTAVEPENCARLYRCLLKEVGGERVEFRLADWIVESVVEDGEGGV